MSWTGKKRTIMEVQVEHRTDHLGVEILMRFRFDGREIEIVEISISGATLNWPWSAAKRQKTIERQNDRTKNLTLARPVAFLPTRRKSRAPGSPARHRRAPSRTRLTAVIFSQPLLLSQLGSAGRTGNVSSAAETLRLGPRG